MRFSVIINERLSCQYELPFKFRCFRICPFHCVAGCDLDLGDVIYKPPRDGPTLWEIGIPNRSAAEFYVPDPDPKYINELYVNHPDRFSLLNADNLNI